MHIHIHFIIKLYLYLYTYVYYFMSQILCLKAKRFSLFSQSLLKKLSVYSTCTRMASKYFSELEEDSDYTYLKWINQQCIFN